MSHDHKTPSHDYGLSVAVDLTLLTVVKGELHCLMLKRNDAAVVGGGWALPGGFVHKDTSVEDTVKKILINKANLKTAYLEQLMTFGALDRDLRGRVITIAYFALTPAATLTKAIDGRQNLALAKVNVPWEGEIGGPVTLSTRSESNLPMAFDHSDIIGAVVRRLRGKLDYTTVGLELLQNRFTLRELQEIHEAILGRRLTKPAFRRKILDRGLIAPTGEREQASAFRPAEYYKRIG